LLTGKADQIWRMIEEEEEIKLNIWKNVSTAFPSQTQSNDGQRKFKSSLKDED
jgi:hypothetical protein